MRTKLASIIKFILLLLFIGLVIYGQETVGRVYLLFQFIGIAGITILLWDYNRKFI